MNEAKLLEVLEEMELALEYLTRRYAVEAAVSNGLMLVLARAGLVTPEIADIIRKVGRPQAQGNDAFLAALDERVTGLAAAIRVVQDETVSQKFDA